MLWLIILACIVGLVVLLAFGPVLLAGIRLWFLELAIRFLTWRLFRDLGKL